MGQAEQDCKDRTNRTGLPAQGCKNKTSPARQKVEDSRKDSQNRTARYDRQIYSARTDSQTGETEQDC
jgi:hypothetical protein